MPLEAAQKKKITTLCTEPNLKILKLNKVVCFLKNLYFKC